MGRDTNNRPDADWNDRRVDAMRWVIRMKREANPELVDALLQKSGDRPIVEHSRHDSFWGARPEGGKLVGQNILGRLWMELRQQVRDGDPRALASAWEDPISPKAAARGPAVDEAGATVPASPGIVSRRRFLEAAGNDPAEGADTWQRIKSGYAALYRESGERIHHSPTRMDTPHSETWSPAPSRMEPALPIPGPPQGPAADVANPGRPPQRRSGRPGRDRRRLCAA